MCSCNASLASNHSYSLFFVRRTAISPIPNGLTVFAERPEHSRRISLMSMNTRLLGLLTRCMFSRSGLSFLYFRSAHIRRCASPASTNLSGHGASIVPRVMLVRKPARRRMERMPRFWVVWGTEMRAWRARKAFWRRAQRSCGSGIGSTWDRLREKPHRSGYQVPVAVAPPPHPIIFVFLILAPCTISPSRSTMSARSFPSPTSSPPTNTLLSHSWSHVIIGMWHKYPNPHCSHVVTVDVVDRSVNPSTGIIRTERVLGCKQRTPTWIVKVRFPPPHSRYYP